MTKGNKFYCNCCCCCFFLKNFLYFVQSMHWMMPLDATLFNWLNGEFNATSVGIQEVNVDFRMKFIFAIFTASIIEFH